MSMMSNDIQITYFKFIISTVRKSWKREYKIHPRLEKWNTTFTTSPQVR